MDIVIRRIAESLAARARALVDQGRADGSEALILEAEQLLESHSVTASTRHRQDYEFTVRALSRHDVMVPSKYLGGEGRDG